MNDKNGLNSMRRSYLGKIGSIPQLSQRMTDMDGNPMSASSTRRKHPCQGTKSWKFYNPKGLARGLVPMRSICWGSIEEDLGLGQTIFQGPETVIDTVWPSLFIIE